MTVTAIATRAEIMNTAIKATIINKRCSSDFTIALPIDTLKVVTKTCGRYT